MPKFQAKKIDLDLELVTLDGSEVVIPGPSLTGSAAAAVFERLTAEDKEFNEIHDGAAGPFVLARHYAGQLSELYGGDGDAWGGPDWWIDNLDRNTIADIKQFAGETLLGVKKKED